MALSTKILDSGCDFHSVTVGEYDILMQLVPPQRISIHIYIHGKRTLHDIAVKVGHISHRDIHIGLFYLGIRNFKIDEQLIAIDHITVFHIVELA